MMLMGMTVFSRVVLLCVVLPYAFLSFVFTDFSFFQTTGSSSPYHGNRNVCAVQKTVADCSYKHLWTIPLFIKSDVSENLTRLLLNNNLIQALPNGAFNGLKRLETLRLGNNVVRMIDGGAFGGLSRLKVLGLENITMTNLPKRIFSELSSLTTLRLDDNLIPVIGYGTFSALRHLTSLRLDDNEIVRVFEGDFSGLGSLEILRLDDNEIEEISEGAFANLVSLKTLRLDDNYLIHIPDGLFSHLTNLESLKLDDNVIEEVSEGAFANLVSLKTLRLDYNCLKHIPGGLFSDLTSLESLDLSDNSLSSVSVELFENCKSLKTLRLDENEIAEIPPATFDGNKLLTSLRLDRNLIESVTESTFSPETVERLTTLNLSRNPFDCSCSLLWFRDLFKGHLVSLKHVLVSSKHTFHQDRFDCLNPYSVYECVNLPGTSLDDFVLDEQQCLLGRSAYEMTVAFCVLLIFALSSLTLFYRFRWHIRLRLYEVFRGKPERQFAKSDDDFRYDLFVSYDSEDANWVNNHLRPELEQGMGLRLCVHQRDFIPGKNIVDNIVDCLRVSKRVLAVFSPSFAESQWCHFELELCLSQVIDNNDVMVIVMLKQVPPRDMSGAMLALVNTTTYIEWRDDSQYRAWFWRQIAVALSNILPK